MEAILQVDEQGQLRLPQSMLDAISAHTPCALKVSTTPGKIEITLEREPEEAVLIEENGLLLVQNSTPFSAVDVIAKDRQQRL